MIILPLSRLPFEDSTAVWCQWIALLPDRAPEVLAAWLREHPGREIITRDRSHDYAQGSTQGAPHAHQVADRWHLVGNYREAVQRVLERHPAQLRAAARRAAETQPAEPPQDPEPAYFLLAEAETHSAQNHPALQPPSEMEIRYTEIKALERQGVSQRAMARRLHLGRTTVRKYLRSSQVPARHHGPQSRSTVLPYLNYLKQRWDGGVQEYMQLWKELQGQGYRGSYSSVRRALLSRECANWVQRRRIFQHQPRMFLSHGLDRFVAALLSREKQDRTCACRFGDLSSPFDQNRFLRRHLTQFLGRSHPPIPPLVFFRRLVDN